MNRLLVALLLTAAAAAAAAGPHKSTGTLADQGTQYQDARVDSSGTITATARPADLLKTLDTTAAGGEQILFGDLHVHSTVSWDAFVFSLPVFGGTGAHPPAEACDFARYCSSLDFFALTDHAETLTPRQSGATAATRMTQTSLHSPGLNGRRPEPPPKITTAIAT
jgi:hypothetical protein